MKMKMKGKLTKQKITKSVNFSTLVSAEIVRIAISNIPRNYVKNIWKLGNVKNSDPANKDILEHVGFSNRMKAASMEKDVPTSTKKCLPSMKSPQIRRLKGTLSS